MNDKSLEDVEFQPEALAELQRLAREPGPTMDLGEYVDLWENGLLEGSFKSARVTDKGLAFLEHCDWV